eukprot:g31792.t1
MAAERVITDQFIAECPEKALEPFGPSCLGRSFPQVPDFVFLLGDIRVVVRDLGSVESKAESISLAAAHGQQVLDRGQCEGVILPLTLEQLIASSVGDYNRMREELAQVDWKQRLYGIAFKSRVVMLQLYRVL